MNIKILCKKSFVGYWGVRFLLNEIGYIPNDSEDYIALHMLNPGDNLRSYADAISLTDNMDVNHQLRFFLKDRVLRRMKGLAYSLISRYGLSKITIENTKFLDEESKYFFDLLNHLFDVELVYKGNKNRIRNHFLLNEHNKIEEKIIQRDASFLFKIAEEYLSVGNFWALERIFEFLPIDNKKYEIKFARLKAISAVLEGDALKAQLLHEKWKFLVAAENLWAPNYGLSMLFLRFLPDELKNIDLAEKLLNEAYDITNKASYNKVDRIFNRNGYALILFRKGMVDEAIHLLTQLIAELNTIEGKVALMHKSVIMYNLSQCYTAVHAYDKAIEVLNDVISIDHDYPEYHLELSKNYRFIGDFTKSISCIKQAIEIDKYIFEAYDQLAFCYLEEDNIPLAKKYYEMAYKLEPDNESVVYNLAFCLAEDNKHKELIDFLHEKTNIAFFKEYYDEVNIVFAEALSFEDSKSAATNFLRSRYNKNFLPDEIRNCLQELEE